jgi:hypothetical protein
VIVQLPHIFFLSSETLGLSTSVPSIPQIDWSQQTDGYSDEEDLDNTQHISSFDPQESEPDDDEAYEHFTDRIVDMETAQDEADDASVHEDEGHSGSGISFGDNFDDDDADVEGPGEDSNDEQVAAGVRDGQGLDCNYYDE